MRNRFIINHRTPELFMAKAFEWARQFKQVAYFKNSSYTDNWTENEFENFLAVDALDFISIDEFQAFERWKQFADKTNDWMVGYLSYDLKNDVEKLVSNNSDNLDWPDLFFFVPRYLLLHHENRIEVLSFELNIDKLIETIENTKITSETSFQLELKPDFEKESYLENVQKIKQHIENGDIYEMNYCVKFIDNQANISPFDLFTRVQQVTPVPFSAFLRNTDAYVISASPERFLKKKGRKLLSQPIKGTARRAQSKTEDAQIKSDLLNNTKEIAENVMIADLVRNDLSRVAEKASVKVAELAGLYSYPTVHQLISTISANLRGDVHWVDAIKACFPMGSMTGAPKVRAMQLIDKYENMRRGVYSGAIGYVTPNGDFDFNVVIRSALYDAAKNYLAIMVGGAITSLSVPEEEYRECLLKIDFWFKLLHSDETTFYL